VLLLALFSDHIHFFSSFFIFPFLVDSSFSFFLFPFLLDPSCAFALPLPIFLLPPLLIAFPFLIYAAAATAAPLSLPLLAPLLPLPLCFSFLQGVLLHIPFCAAPSIFSFVPCAFLLPLGALPLSPPLCACLLALGSYLILRCSPLLSLLPP